MVREPEECTGTGKAVSLHKTLGVMTLTHEQRESAECASRCFCRGIVLSEIELALR